MFGLVVIEGMNLSGHPWIINEIPITVFEKLQTGLVFAHF